jgi:hypothetical protein
MSAFWNPFWSYFWPVFGAGMIIGIVAAVASFRVRIVRVRERPHDPDLIPQSPRRRAAVLVGGVALSIAVAALWHGPLGAGDRFAATIERQSREALDHYEMYKVSAHLHRGPLTRQLIFAGPANLDDFQRGELVRLFNQLPGVHSVTWTERSEWLPLIVEAMLVAIGGFLFGLPLAYLAELRRRYNSQWNW